MAKAHGFDGWAAPSAIVLMRLPSKEHYRLALASENMHSLLAQYRQSLYGRLSVSRATEMEAEPAGNRISD